MVTGIVIAIVLILFLYWLSGTELGCGLRATGNNEDMIRALGRNTQAAKLIALAISASSDPLTAKALDQLAALRGCEAHSSVMLSQVDAGIYKRLGLNLTCEPRQQTNKLYYK